MKILLIKSGLVLTGLSLFAFSSTNQTNEFNDISTNVNMIGNNIESGSFTERYTRTYNPDKTVWAHRVKEYTLTSNNVSSITSLENIINKH